MSPSSWSPDGQQIAFSAIKPGEDPGRDTTIYIVNADGSGLTELPSVGNDINPAWSPDGEWLAFHSSGNLAIMRPDGSAPTVIWDGEGGACAHEPQWSPDSQRIGVPMQMGGCEWAFPMTREVWVMSRDGATVTTIATVTYENDGCVHGVAFSPDGTQVAYISEDCRPWIANADGSGQSAPLDDFPYWWTSAAYPQWGGEKEVPPPEPIPPAQPEGKVVERCEGGTPPQICVRDTKTGQVTQVTDSLDFGAIDRCAWSPDGQQIIFNAGSDFEVTQRHDHKLYVINADGSDLRQVTSGDTNDIHPVWSPDRQWIAFHRNCDLWLIRSDGSDAQRLLEGSSEFCAVAMVWSPDNQQVAFLNTPGETAPREIWVINRDGTDPRVVYSFEQPLEPWEVAWSPGGRQIACWYGGDGKDKGLLVNADGSGEPKMIDRMPWLWLPHFWPQWGGGE
jgi:Tol biopolymer transport system component